ncbi:UDP-N-acetylglucosamine 4,6-dehydratase (inverting) [subsurface metagenome]
MLDSKIILITGGTGSFGKKITEVILKEYEPKAIRIFSRGELEQQKMREQFKGYKDSDKLRFFIGDVRDKNRLHRAMDNVNIVIHTAALKQVPTCEYNPIEAIKTNIDGAINIIDVTIDNNVEKVIALSTDKCVYPVNLYGATKLVMEKLFTQGNVYRREEGTKFSCVRYGNVMASRGSVIPIFKKQKKEGVITITDIDMTRFWITLEQASRFVLDCIDSMQGGEIFIPKIPSMKIIDLAKAIAPKAEIRITGIRPGEKMNEILLTKEEVHHTKESDNCFIVEPEHHFWGEGNYKKGEPLPLNFAYSSDKNDQWLTKQRLIEMLEEL